MSGVVFKGKQGQKAMESESVLIFISLTFTRSSRQQLARNTYRFNVFTNSTGDGSASGNCRDRGANRDPSEIQGSHVQASPLQYAAVAAGDLPAAIGR